jgi:hypothetical protein
MPSLGFNISISVFFATLQAARRLVVQLGSARMAAFMSCCRKETLHYVDLQEIAKEKS